VFSRSIPPLQFVTRTIYLLPVPVIGHQYSRVSEDLLNPGGESSTSSIPPVERWLDIILSLAAGPKNPVCWDMPVAKYLATLNQMGLW